MKTKKEVSVANHTPTPWTVDPIYKTLIESTFVIASTDTGNCDQVWDTKERATIAIRMMRSNKTGDFGRAFDDCFEMGDGEAVVSEIARRAMRTPALLALVKLNRGVAWVSVEAAITKIEAQS